MSQVSYQHLVLLHGVCMAGDSETPPSSPPLPTGRIAGNMTGGYGIMWVGGGALWVVRGR